MSADLLRQLDSYGDHVKTMIEPVDADQVIEKAREKKTPAPKDERKRWRWPSFLTNPATALVLIVVAVVAIASISFVGSEVSTELGGELVIADSASSRAQRFSGQGGSVDAAAPAPTELEPLADRAFEQDAAAVDEASAAEDETPASPPVPVQDGAGPVVAGQPAEFGRDVIFVADMTIAVTDVTAATAQANRIIESAGGFLFAQQTTGGAETTSVITYKVVPAGFQDTLSRLGELGTVRSQNVSAEDVTERIVDLESRIRTAEASVERLRGLLAEADGVPAITRIESELLDRESELESMRGQLRTLEDRVAMATIVVILTESLGNPRFALAVSTYVSQDDDGSACPGSRSLAIDPGEDVTVCVEIANNGDTPLAQVDITDPVLGLDETQMLPVAGNVAGILEPGETIVLATDTTVDERLTTKVTVTAVPVNDQGDELPDRMLTRDREITVSVIQPDELPGFTDAVSKGWGALQSIGSIILIAAGAVLPFIWIPVVIAIIWWWRRRRTV